MRQVRIGGFLFALSFPWAEITRFMGLRGHGEVAMCFGFDPIYVLLSSATSPRKPDRHTAPINSSP